LSITFSRLTEMMLKTALITAFVEKAMFVGVLRFEV
jgi:hypothetical protein